MRVFAAALLSAACTTLPLGTPAEWIAGCWIARNDDGYATTLRWMPDADRPGALQGDKLTYLGGGAAEAERYRLEPQGATWALCQGDRCWQVAQEVEGSLDGGRAFIDAHREELRISIVGDGAERVIFDGVRDGCD